MAHHGAHTDGTQKPRLNHWILLAVLGGVGLCALLIFAFSGIALIATTGQETTAPATRISSTVIAVQASTATPLPALPPAQSITRQPTSEPSATPPPPTATSVPGVDPTSPPDCPPPDGWVLHYVEPGETLFAYVLGAISTGVNITTRDVRQANCLESDLLQIGQILYLPPEAAENAPSSEPAGAPPGVVASGPRVPACDPHCTISIRPGWRAEQIAAVIDNTPVGFWGSDFLAAISAGAGTPSYAFLASKPPGASLEGFLYPGTYELTNDTTAAGFRDMLLAAFGTVYHEGMNADAAARGLSFYQALTLASIIQRESWAYQEQVLISSVFHNRLRVGEKLGATVTLQYALGGPGNWWPRVSGSQVNTGTPYNTNLNPGLPPTPINSPGIDAIRAALYPADTNYLFFTGNCQGPGNLYASSYDQHLANVNLCR